MKVEKIEKVVMVVAEDDQDGGYTACRRRWGIHTQGDDLNDPRLMVRDVTRTEST